MSGASIDISIDDRGLIRRLEKLDAEGLQKLRPAYASIGEYMVRETEQRFSDQKDPDGHAWEKLSAATLVRKKHSKILTESARLRGGINFQAGTDAVHIGTNEPYGAAHQFGLDEQVNVSGYRRKVKSRNVKKGGKKTASGVSFVTAHVRKAHIPARPYLGVNDDDRKEIAEILMDYLMEIDK